MSGGKFAQHDMLAFPKVEHKGTSFNPLSTPVPLVKPQRDAWLHSTCIEPKMFVLNVPSKKTCQGFVLQWTIRFMIPLTQENKSGNPTPLASKGRVYFPRKMSPVKLQMFRGRTKLEARGSWLEAHGQFHVEKHSAAHSLFLVQDVKVYKLQFSSRKSMGEERNQVQTQIALHNDKHTAERDKADDDGALYLDHGSNTTSRRVV